MKKLIILLLISLVVSCTNQSISTVYNYPNGVIIGGTSNNAGFYYLNVRHKQDSVYKVSTVRVTKYEFSIFNAGDKIYVKDK